MCFLLWGWASATFAGMSLDYMERFDLIPQAVVLALALELRMDPGTCHALGAMYHHLRKAFKVAGALDLWWPATNGILHGPLSVILGERAHHDLQIGGRLPLPVRVRADAPPPLLSGRGCGGETGGGAPPPPQGCGPRLCRAGVVRLCG